MNDTLFEAGHGRGAIDSMTMTGERVPTTSPVVLPTSAMNMGVVGDSIIGTRPKHTPDSEYLFLGEKEQVPMEREYRSPTEHQVISPVGMGHILGEGAAIFTDMTETMLTVLDKQMAWSDTAQRPECSLLNNILDSRQISSQNEIRSREPRSLPVNIIQKKDKYPDLYLPVPENYKISDKFYGHVDRMLADNNPLVLVELTGLSYKYGTTIYMVDIVNGTMYGRTNEGFRKISERATVKPQYRGTSLANMYGPAQPMHVSTLLGMTQMVTPLAKSTPITQSSQLTMIHDGIPPVRDRLETIPNEPMRVDALEKQMRHISIYGLPSDLPSL